jgi:hypothetical protein
MYGIAHFVDPAASPSPRGGDQPQGETELDVLTKTVIKVIGKL